jgi:hypothetical protein
MTSREFLRLGWLLTLLIAALLSLACGLGELARLGYGVAFQIWGPG